ncbi:unnamed protein product [Penicillium nalgiovense]|nr:unnamed protein product [Penicillium nalgiovense]
MDPNTIILDIFDLYKGNLTNMASAPHDVSQVSTSLLGLRPTLDLPEQHADLDQGEDKCLTSALETCSCTNFGRRLQPEQTDCRQRDVRRSPIECPGKCSPDQYGGH